MSATLLSALFCNTLVHPQRNVDFASYVPQQLWDGADVFADPYRWAHYTHTGVPLQHGPIPCRCIFADPTGGFICMPCQCSIACKGLPLPLSLLSLYIYAWAWPCHLSPCLGPACLPASEANAMLHSSCVVL